MKNENKTADHPDLNNHVSIAYRLNRIRKERKMTLEELAEASGLSESLLSKIENNLVSPPIATLLKLSKALGVNISFFFNMKEKENKPFVLTPRDRRETLHRSGGEYGYSYQLLAPGKKDKNMEPFFIRFSNKRKGALFRHEGEEFLFLVKGVLEYTVGDEKALLHPGDTIYIDSDVHHRIRCLSDEPAEAIAVVFSPSS